MRAAKQLDTTRKLGLGVVLFVAGLVSLVLPSASARAQEPRPGKIDRVGFLRAGQPPAAYLDGFQQGLREAGYVYGQNVVVELRTTDGSTDQLPMPVEELLRSNVDVLLA